MDTISPLNYLTTMVSSPWNRHWNQGGLRPQDQEEALSHGIALTTFLVLYLMGKGKSQWENTICPPYACSTTWASKPSMRTPAGLGSPHSPVSHSTSTTTTTTKSMGWIEGFGREKRGTCQPGYLAGPILLSSFSPAPHKDKHSKEVWIKNKPLSDEASFSWALRYFSKDLLSHSFIPLGISWH